MAVLPVSALSLVACQKKDPAACTNAQSTIRQAIAVEDFASARRWRDYAYKHCQPAELEALDKEIVAKEADAQKKKADDESKKQRTDQLLKLFSDWTAQNRANPATAAVNVTCTAPADPKKEKERWCTRERVAGEFKLRVTYWEAEPDAYEFATTAPSDVSCDQLGPGTVIKNAHEGALLHCDLTGGPLAGSQALAIRTAQGVQVSVFSAKYAEKNEAFRRRLNQ
jgi:hypothetical protein